MKKQGNMLFPHLIYQKWEVWPRACKKVRQIPETDDHRTFVLSNLGSGIRWKGAVLMDEEIKEVAPRERQIIDLLLQGCDNSEIARDLNIAERTVKAHFNRLFMRFGIKGGIKRVKLATLLYRRQLCSESQQIKGHQASANTSSSGA
jgi:hypothetical protein